MGQPVYYSHYNIVTKQCSEEKKMFVTFVTKAWEGKVIETRMIFTPANSQGWRTDISGVPRGDSIVVWKLKDASYFEQTRDLNHGADILSTLKAMRVDEIKYTRNVSDWYLNDPAGRWTQGMPPCPTIPSISYSLPNTSS